MDYGDILDHLPEAVIVCNADGEILRGNKSAEIIFDLDAVEGRNVADVISADSWREVLREGNTCVVRNGVAVTLALWRGKNRHILSSDITDETFTARRELLRKQEFTSELGVLFDSYIDENIWVTDGSGKTIFVSAAVAHKHGVPQEKLVGRYVQDLEREKVFSPSVTVEVLRTNRQSAVLQHTMDGRLCVAVGIPTYDSDGKIERVLSITRDCTNQIAIGDALILDEPTLMHMESDESFALRFVTRNPAVRKMLEIAKMAAPTDSTILIEGESGVGKSLLAKLIHEISNRADGPFLAINCAVIAENLFESELFGYASGAFTGANSQGKAGLIETAQGGTLFLDEVEEIPLAQQVKLLEVIQGRCIKRIGSTESVGINIRIICAAKSNLAELAAASKFRMDLFYRLNVVTLHIPPLRDRREDIPHLLHHIAARINRDYGLNKTFTQAAMEKLCQYDYPGNVRELAHAIEQAMVTTAVRRIDAVDLPEKLRADCAGDGGDQEGDVAVSALMPLAAAQEQTERQLLQLALNTCGMKAEIASVLELSPTTLWRKMQKYGLAR
jgi:transcriptional regulator with PAS, ATPase and Fis domain